MELDVRNLGLKLTRASRRYIERRAGYALRAFQEQVERVTVTVIRDNRRDRNAGYRCEMTLRVHGLAPLHVIERDATVYGVCAKAMRLAELSIARALASGSSVPVALTSSN